eukprot:scpid50419/ scgid4353/ Mucin-4; Ascites sialoglycoprotein; Pancreatic adenocarcinoma mucin; Testis mucin; Tracheobronchial mucin; Mucin-4 alpha chain; Ascites sialoglycoprotein 1; Mucin-4 beta chain; Ascites sialoglycoprotein 2
MASAKTICECLVIALLAGVHLARTTHFRGGLISCHPVLDNTDGGVDSSGSVHLECQFRIGWRLDYSAGTVCNSTLRANQELLNGPGSKFRLRCYSGCTRRPTVDYLKFYCTEFSDSELWTQGANTFRYTLSGSNQIFTAAMRTCCWIDLVIGKDKDFKWGITMNITKRTDTGRVNSSPTSAQLPLVRLQYGCPHNISVHTEDPDGDLVRCRWAQFSAANGVDECGDVCNAVPSASLLNNPCVLQLPGNLSVGYHVVALTLEDFPPANPNAQAFSQVPLQFLIDIFNSSVPCNVHPTFVSPTPEHNTCFAIKKNESYNTLLRVQHASMQTNITSISLTAPVGMTRSSLLQHTDTSHQYTSMNVSWTPGATQYGQHVFCFLATDSTQQTTSSRCITLLAGASPPETVAGTMLPSTLGNQTAPHLFATFTVDFDQMIFKPTSFAKIRVSQVNGSMSAEVYSLTVATSPDVTLRQHPDANGHYQLRFMVRKRLTIGARYAVTFDHGAVVGVQSCTGGGVPFQGISEPSPWQFVADHTVGNISDCSTTLSQFLAYGEIRKDWQLDLGDGSACLTSNISESANELPMWGSQHSTLTICENGLIMLDQDQPIRHPQLFPGNWTTQPTILAPYWCLADNSYSKNLPDGLRSHVWYHFYDRQVSSEKAMLEEVESLIIARERSKDGAFYFTATWAAVVTWERITPYPSIYQYQLHNTFQAILASDGVRSFAVYSFDSNSIQWSVPAVHDVNSEFGHAVSGFTSQNHHYTDKRSGTPQISSIDDGQPAPGQECVSGTMMVYKLFTQSTVDGPRARCLEWYAMQPHANTWMQHFSPCPCTLSQAQADSRFQVIRSLAPRLCFQNAVPSITGSSQECCYR